MKKNIFFMMLFVCVTYGVMSQTNIPGGIISGTWTLAGSPYHVQGDIQVSNNTTLTIEPGVRVIFQGYYKLNVQGKLLAVGTQTDTIFFTAADTTNGWKGIRYVNTPDIGSSEIKYCDIRYAKGNNFGGALYFENYSAVTVSHCRISNCSAGNGGAIACWTWSDPVITHNLIINNTASTDGGGIWFMGSQNTNVSYNIITNNTANSGGGIFCYVSSPLFQNNIIVNNSAVMGGGIRANNNSSPVIINNIIANNSAENGGGLYSDLTSYPTVRNTIIWGNTATTNGQQVYIPDESNPSFYYNNIQGGLANFFLNGNSFLGIYQNNINADPQIVSPSAGSGTGFEGLNADWSLQSSSPCIDSGDPNASYPELDMAGNSRVSVCKIDMGAYEFQNGLPLTITFTNSESYHCAGGNNGTVTAQLSGGSGGTLNYFWNTGETTFYKNITGAGMYAVTITDVTSGCSVADSTPVVINTFEINAGTEKNIYCSGSSVQLDSITSNYTGNMPLIYEWLPATGLNNPTIPNPIATVNNTSVFVVNVTTSNGCVDDDFINVNLTPLTIDVGTASLYCGTEKTLNNFVTNYTGTGLLTYQWAPSLGLSNDTVQNPIVSVSEDKTYYVTVTTPSGCTAIDSIFIDYLQLPINAGTDKNIVCGSSVQLKALPLWTVNDPGWTGNIFSLHFVNSDTGYAVGYDGKIIKTIDGGVSWNNLNSPTNVALHDVFFINDTIGYIVGGQWGSNAIILKTINAGNTWNIYSSTTDYVLKSVYFTSLTTGFAVGGDNNNYIILRTINGGTSWSTVKTGSSFSLNDVFFTSSTTGFAAGNNGKIMRTLNAGLTWDTLTTGSTSYLVSINFINNSTGFAVGNYDFLKTTDGGNTWSSKTLNNSYGLQSVFFISENKGYITSHNVVYYTSDGGLTWDYEQLPTSNSMKAIQFTDSLTGYAIGNTSLAKLHIPVAYQWSQPNSLSNPNIFNPIAKPVSNTAYHVTASFADGCESFDTVLVNVQPLAIMATDQYDITCGISVPLNFNYINQADTNVLDFQWAPAAGLDNSNVINPKASPFQTTTYYVTVSTANGCSASDSTIVIVNPLVINAGINQAITCGEEIQLSVGTQWINISTNNFYFKDLYFTSADTGYAVSSGVYKTTDGGYSWQLISQTTGHTLQSVFFVNAHVGYAVGNDGIFFKTTDGQNWTMNWIYGTQLKSVFFINTNTGYVVGDAGKIYKTVDGGGNWTLQSSGTTKNLKSVFFTTSEIGFAVGENGAYLKTINGGSNWVIETLIGSFNVLNDVYFPDVNNGYIAGSGSVFLKTTDGGINWNPMNPNWFEGKSIYFFDANTGYVAGMFGAIGGIAKTVDGGNNWTVNTYNNLSSLYGMHFPTPSVGYALGNGQFSNVIMKLPAPPDALTWSPSIGLNNTAIANPIANPLSTTTYTVSTLTGACPAIDSVTVYVNALSINAGQDVWDTLLVCRGTVQLDSVLSNYNGSTPLTYQWFPSTGLNSDTIANPIAELTSSTTYQVTVSNNSGCVATDDIYINIFPLIINAGQDLQMHCGEVIQLDSVVTNHYGNDTLFYLWSPATGLSSDTVPNPQIVAANIAYTLTVSNNLCQATDGLIINLMSLPTPEICIVSVDSSNRNRVVWEKPLMATAIDSFYIYRETNQTGNYAKIGAVSYDSLSVFVDQNSQPQVQSNRYKISLVDSCGIETTKSTHHKTMHLAINQGMGSTWNLIWEPYEGFAISSYNIYRGDQPNNMQQIGTMAGVNTQYSDINAPAGFLYYQVEIMGNWCNPSKSYNFSRSNIATNNPSSIFFSDKKQVQFNLFPNPAEEVFFIEPSSDIKAIKIYNALGQLVSEKNSSFEKGINIKNLKNGLYFIEILSKNGYSYHKIYKVQ